MRTTLRRSCDACARSKLRCDLLLPQCSRCSKRSTECLYANEPMSASLTETFPIVSTDSSPRSEIAIVKLSPNPGILFNNPGVQSFDPFDSYPQTRLPRAHVQRLIQHFLSTIAFQYYPLDMNGTSNPFVVSWFPLALTDSALFHVSLQTASLDTELRAQQGFPNSDILMADSVSLVRLKVEDPELALQDETINSVVTLAAIEFGKGNTAVSQMHIDGVKSMVRLRGGIQQVKAVSPLTARMVAWVSMIVQQSPQFATQDDILGREGIAPPPQWNEPATYITNYLLPLATTIDLDPTISDILCRLRFLFHKPTGFDMTTNDFHDLACFVLHRLLDFTTHPIDKPNLPMSSESEIVRYAIVLYLLMAHGPTYFSHAHLQYTTALKLRNILHNQLLSQLTTDKSLSIWVLSIGLAASKGTPVYRWFMTQAKDIATTFGLYAWEDVHFHLKAVLWLGKQATNQLFLSAWEAIWATKI